MSEPTVPTFVAPTLRNLDVSLDEAQQQTLARYLDMMLAANRRVNLTAVREPDAAWKRLILDSLTLVPGLEPLEPGATLIDIGSGGGLPGIPLAIARPDLRVTLLEATGKKARFLQQCADELPLENVSVVNERAEHVGQDKAHREKYDLAVVRAVGSVSELLEYAMPLVKTGGRVLAMKGSAGERELAAASDALSVLGAGDVQLIEAYPPADEAAGADQADIPADARDEELVILSIVKEHATPRSYPRRAGVPRHEPL